MTAVATDEVTRTAFSKLGGDDSNLTSDERIAAVMISMAGRELLQNSQYQFARGYLDEEHWQTAQRLIRQQLQQPITRAGLLSDGVRPSFRRIVEEIDRELDAETN